MTYQVLARKWRPQDFSSLVGQEPIVTALRNALAEGRIAQAYVFSGIRGVGKTTAARVLAKALNCQGGEHPDRPSVDPCNECPPCRDITSGHDMDVLEVDAATYSKVEQVRELTESLRYGAARDRYKVVVLDEVHRLSRQAFDALLKIVEEPPPHLVFVFATTELDAVPATILSRCQEFQFRRVPSPVLAQHLRRISEAEKIAVSDTSLRLIARAGEGSVRDSVALLDQLATFGNSTIDDDSAKNLLGGLDTAVFQKLLVAILGRDRRTISGIVREIEANGWDPHNVFGQFLLFVRDALQLSLGTSPEEVDLPLEQATELAESVRSVGTEGLLQLLQLLLSSEPTVRRSELGMLALEIAWLRAAELPKVTRIADILSGRVPIDPPTPSGPEGVVAISSVDSAPPLELQRRGGSSGEVRGNRPSPRGRTTTGRETKNDSTADRGLADRGLANGSLDRGDLENLMREIGAKRPALAALLKPLSGDLSWGGCELLIPAGDPTLEAALGREGNREILEDILRSIAGPTSGWRWSRARPSDPDTKNRIVTTNPEHGTDAAITDEHPTVRAVLEVFGGKIQNIEPKEGSPEESPT